MRGKNQSTKLTQATCVHNDCQKDRHELLGTRGSQPNNANVVEIATLLTIHCNTFKITGLITNKLRFSRQILMKFSILL